MNLKNAMAYLGALDAHNDREWYHANKEEARAANADFEAFLQELIYKIGEFDPSVLYFAPKELTFKQVRDTRFGKDKSPYNPSFRAHVSSKGKLPVPVGYYFQMKPDGRSFLGGGLFTDMFRDATDMIRGAIQKNAAEWLAIVNAPDFSASFEVKGVKLKNVPAGCDAESAAAEFLKHKSWYLEVPLADEEFDDADALLEKTADIFLAMKPFNDFLNRALEGFEMPKR